MLLTWTACLLLDGRPDHLADLDGDGFVALDDCDDADATVFPGAEEVCDGRQTDCSAAWDGDAGLASVYDDETWEDASELMAADGLHMWGDLELHLCEGTWPGRLHATEGDQLVVGHGAILSGAGEGTIIAQEGDGTLELRDLAIEGGGGCLGSTVRVGRLTSCEQQSLSTVEGGVILSGVSIAGGNEDDLATLLVAGGHLELRDGTTLSGSEADAVWSIDGAVSCTDSTLGGYAGAGVRVHGSGWSVDSAGCSWEAPAVSSDTGVLWEEEGDFSCSPAGCEGAP